MTEKIKNYLGIAIIISLLALSVSAWFFIKTYSRSIEPSSFRSFSASAEGKITALPDVAEFTFSVITQGGVNIAELMKENTKKVNAAIDFTKANGVEQKDIKTQNYNLEPRYQYFSCPSDKIAVCPPAEISGYTINQTVLVKIRDFTKIGDLLSGAIKNGANSVSQLSFTIDDQTLLQDQAREQAIEKAKERAKKIAEAGGFRIGRLLSIDEGVVYPYAMPSSFNMAAESGIKRAAPTIEPGSQEITVNVTLRYEIK